jgi:hypothetical protein
MRRSTLQGSLILWLILSCGALVSHAQEFFTDFTTVPAGAYIPPGPVGPPADPNEAQIADGILKLTLNQNSAGGIFYVDDFSGGAPIAKFRATFKAAIFGSLCCGGGTLPADGFSFNLTPTAVPNPAYGVPAEEGLSTGLAVCFDTWDNGGLEAPAIDVKWDGTQIGVVNMQPSQSPSGGSNFLDVVINLDLDGTIDVSYGGSVIFNNLQTPYTPIAGGKWVFGARTGGANDNHWIDDLRIRVPSGPITITTQPSNTTVTVGRRATFTVDVDGVAPYTFQWFRDGAPIAGATGFSYTTDPVTEADTGAQFVLRGTNSLGFAISSPAVLTVNTDTNPPTVLFAYGSSTLDQIGVEFSETLHLDRATDPVNYAISGGLVVTNVVLHRNGRGVTLQLDSLQAENTLYTVTINDVADEAGNPVAPNSTVQFRSYIGGCAGLIFDTYLNIGGTAVSALTSHPNFPNNPQVRHYLTRFDTREVDSGDTLENYGGRIRGYFIPPESGNWIFYLRSDDASQLFFNPTGPDASGKVLITEELTCCGSFSAHASAPQALVGGRQYYIEVLYKEGGGGDYAQVAAKLSNDPTNPNTLTPIPGAWLGTPAGPAEGVGPVGVASQPATVTVQQNTIATITVNATNANSAPICYQWQRDGIDIPGAVLPSYSFFATSADNGAVFSVLLGVMGSSAVSGNTTLIVTNDIIQPRLLSAAGSATLDTITLQFSELLDPTSAQAAASYSISGLTVNSATLAANGTTVTLITSPHAPGAYTVVAAGVRDLAGNLTDPAANSASFRAFVPSCGFLRFEAYNTGGGVAVSDLLNHPTFPNNPRETLYMTAFDTRTVYPDDSHENYGARVTGFFVPPVSGNYIFYLRSDDASRLYLNPTGLDPAGKILLTEETGCCQAFAAHASAPQALTAGQMYYIEGLLKEGGGGDYLQVATKLDTDPTPPNALRPIGGGSLGVFANPTDVALAITQQPQDVIFTIDPAGATTLFATDFNANNGGFTVETPQPYDGPWVYDAASGSWREDGQNPENSRPNTSTLISPTVTVTRAGGVQLAFAHRYSFEGGAWDGGNVWISINGGAYTMVPGSAFLQNGYNGTVLPNSASILKGQAAFIENSTGYGAGFLTSVANLGTFAVGDTIRVQFIAANDTNTRGEFVPNWQIDSVALSEGITGSPTATFTVAATGSVPGFPNQQPFIQWQRDTGSGFIDIPGATGTSYTFVPTLADNGARYRAVAYLPGATQTSSAATLTVIQLNTPPRFTAGPNQTAAEDSGPQTVAGWATAISPHSIPRVPIVYASDFASTPPGASLFAPARVADGFLHLTDATNFGVVAGFYTPVVTAFVESYNVSFRAYVGGGTCCGATTADGYSVNIANDLPATVAGQLAEEGFGAGLSITFDTWDNGAAEAPAIEIKWLGSVLQAVPIDVALDAAPVAFSDVNIEVSPMGIANVRYAGQLIFSNVTLAGWAPTANLRLGFAARTGGASDNHWIDDLNVTAFSPDASSAEAGQTVQFLVSNDNPSLFSAQPAVSPDGTLTYTPAPNACGSATVSVVARDNGGTASGGRDTSAAQTFVITVTPVNDCPIAVNQTVTARNDTPTAITLASQDPDANGCGAPISGYTIVTPPTKGTLSGTGANLTFTPNAGALGPDSFTYTATDGTCSSSAATVTINIVPGNEPPTSCVAAIFPPTCVITTTNDPPLSVLSLNGSNVCVILVGSAIDPDGSTLQFTWLTNGVPIALGAVATNCFDVGCHTVTLVVSDGTDMCTTNLTFCVTTPDSVTEECALLVDSMNLSRRNKRPLISSLKSAAESFARGSVVSGLNQLEALQNKLRAQVAPTNPAEAQFLSECVQKIIDAVDCAADVGIALGQDSEEGGNQ